MKALESIEMQMGTNFKLASITFHLEAMDRIELPLFKGPFFRSAFGKIFRDIVCIQRHEQCSTCKIAKNCLYLLIFESPQLEDKRIQWRSSHDPHCFLLEPPVDRKKVYYPKDNFRVGLVLIGSGIAYLPYFVLVFEEMGMKGVGSGRGRFFLQKVTSSDIDGEYNIYDGTNKLLADKVALITPALLSEHINKEIKTITIEFITSARLKHNGTYINQIDFPIFIRALLRRYSWLCALYCEEVPELPFEAILSDAEKEVELVSSNLAWQQCEYYSFRQRQITKLGGVVGQVVFTGNLRPFLTLIKLGEYLHIGKGTAFGLGKYIMITHGE